MRKRKDRREFRALPADAEWVTKQAVRHYRTGKLMRRKDGEPFRFPVRRKTQVA